MPDPLGGDQMIGDLLHVFRLAPQHDHLQTMIVIQMNVQRRHHALVMLVLQLGEFLAQQPHMVVVHDGHRSHHGGVGLLRAFLQQLGTRQIAKRFRPVGVPALSHQFVELLEQFALDRYPEAPQISHKSDSSFVARLAKPVPAGAHSHWEVPPLKLLCPVRNCRSPLLPGARRRQFCERGHSFDVARSGYINLLQPQDRRSHRPGDTAAAIAARRRLHDRGVAGPLLHAMAALLQPSNKDIVLDAGCGEGFYLGTLAQKYGCAAAGVDISVAAIEAAAKRYPECTWIVANADRFVPFADRTFSVVMSITARRNPSEFRRVLRDDGRLLIALPAPDDLIELRGGLRGAGRDRTAGVIRELADHFTLTSQSRVSTTAALDASAVQDVLHSIYRPLRARPVEAMQLTFSLDLLLFRPSSPGPSTPSNDSSKI